MRGYVVVSLSSTKIPKSAFYPSKSEVPQNAYFSTSRIPRTITSNARKRGMVTLYDHI